MTTPDIEKPPIDEDSHVGGALRAVSSVTAFPAVFREGWAAHQRLLMEALRPLTDEQLGLQIAPGEWALWQQASHIAGARIEWLHEKLGEGEAGVLRVFRNQGAAGETAPRRPAWEVDGSHPRGSTEVIEALERTWDLLDGCLVRWTPDVLEAPHPALHSGRTRSWVLWHLLEHDVHHGGQIGLILSSHGLKGLDL